MQLQAQKKVYTPDPSPVIQQKLEDWQDLKFGFMMHWGPYSQWGVVESWSICPEDFPWVTDERLGVDSNYTYNEYVARYENLKQTFNPVKFDPEKWAEAARYAGMKYLVFTTKHHDGFCMFDTKTTSYKITDPSCKFSSNPHSDVTKELFTAFRKDNFWIGAYFSLADWNSDDYWWRRLPAIDRYVNYSTEKHPEKWNAFVKFTHAQVNELMSNYGNIDILWMDGGWAKAYDSAQLVHERDAIFAERRMYGNPQNEDLQMGTMLKDIRSKQPGTIVVARSVGGLYENYITPEQKIPEEGLPYPWETCMTMAIHWSYHPKDPYKPTEQLIKILVDIVSKGGNLLLNASPKPDGTLPDTVYQRLKEIGDWMQINSESIYGTRKNSFYSENENIRYTKTKDGKTVYVFLFSYPEKSFKLTHLPFKNPSKITMLGAKGKNGIKTKNIENGIEVSLNNNLKTASKYVWVLKFEE